MSTPQVPKKNDLVTIEFAIEKRHFPVPTVLGRARPLPKNVRRHRKADLAMTGGEAELETHSGYLIATILYSNNGTLTYGKIKGRLPHHGPYYCYTAVCEPHPDYFQIVSVVSCERDFLTNTMLLWVLRYELGYEENDARRICGDAANDATDSFGYTTIDTLPDPVRTGINTLSAYVGDTQRETILRRWYGTTASSISSVLAGLSTTDPDCRAAFYAILATEPWRLAFRPIAKRFGLVTDKVEYLISPATLRLVVGESIVGHTTPTTHMTTETLVHIPTTANKDTPEGQQEMAEFVATVAEHYVTLRKYCTSHGHVVFYEHNIPSHWSPLVLAFMIHVLRIVVTVDVETRPTYWLAEAHAQTQVVISAMHDVWTRHQDYASDDNASNRPELPALSASDVTDEQRTAIEAVETRPFVLLRGTPGTGKTYVMEKLVERYGSASGRVMVATLQGSMVAGHHDRGLTCSTTIHRHLTDLEALPRAIHRLATRTYLSDVQKKELASKRRQLGHLIKTLSLVEIYIIDEFSNVDLELYAQIIVIFPNLRTFVAVFDPDQISPIGPGYPCVQLIKAFPDSVVHLTKNLRAEGTAAHDIVANDQHLLNLEFDRMQFITITVPMDLDECPEILRDLPKHNGALQGCFLVNPSRPGHSSTLEHDIQWICRHICPNALTRQILSITNAERVAINTQIQRQEIRRRNDIASVRFFAGQRLTVHRTFAAVKKVTTDSLDKSRHTIHSDKVSNGETFIFKHCQDYNTKTHRWNPHFYPEIHENSSIPKDMIRFMMVRDGRQFCLSDRYVRPDAIIPAWCMTVDKSQGREFMEVVKVLPVTPGGFGKSHAHVGMSRAKKCQVTYGTVNPLQQLRALAMNPQAPRQSILGWLLKVAHKKWIAQSEGIPDGFF